MRSILFASAAIFGLFVTESASAGILTYTGTSYPTDQIVRLDDNVAGVHESVYAGGITLMGVVLNGIALPNGFLAWCVDITHNLIGSSTYIHDSLPADAGLLNPAKINNIGWLIDNFDPNIGTTLDSAATQVAIWDTIYGADLQVSGNSAVTAAADQLLAIAGNTPANEHLAILHRGTTTNQDLAYLTGNTGGGGGQDVPEPISLVLLGAGLLGLGIVRRRKSAS